MLQIIQTQLKGYKMSFLSGLANINPIGALTNLFGSNSFNSTAQWGLRPGNNMGGNFGHSLNLWTGATDSANLQYSHNMGLQHDAQEFAKWQMENAHQIETQDLINAGINPILSANGGASAGVSANSTGAGTGGTDPIAMISAIVGMMNSTKQVKAMVDKTEAETSNINQDTANKKQTFEWTPALNKSLIKMQGANSTKAQAEAVTEAGKQLAYQFENKMAEMNVKKRSEEWFRELKIYEKQMQTELTMAGYNTSNVNMAIRKFGEIIRAIIPISDMVPNVSTNYNVTTNYAPR